MNKEVIKKTKKTSIGIHFNKRNIQLYLLAFQNNQDYFDQEIPTKSIIENTKFFLVNLENIEIYLKNKFVKYIYRVIIFDDSIVKKYTIKNDKRTTEFYNCDKFIISECIELFTDYSFIKKLSSTKKNLFASYFKKGEVLDEKIIDIVIKNNGLLLKFLDKKYHNNTIYKNAVINNGFSIQYIPKESLNEELYFFAILRNPETIKFVPFDMQKIKICKWLTRQNKKLFEFINPEFHKELEIQEENPKNEFLFTPRFFILNLLDDIDKSFIQENKEISIETINYLNKYLDSKIFPTITDLKIIMKKENITCNIATLLDKLGFETYEISSEYYKIIGNYFDLYKKHFKNKNNKKLFYDLKSVLQYIINKLDLPINYDLIKKTN